MTSRYVKLIGLPRSFNGIRKWWEWYYCQYKPNNIRTIVNSASNIWSESNYVCPTEVPLLTYCGSLGPFVPVVDQTSSANHCIGYGEWRDECRFNLIPAKDFIRNYLSTEPESHYRTDFREYAEVLQMNSVFGHRDTRQHDQRFSFALWVTRLIMSVLHIPSSIYLISIYPPMIHSPTYTQSINNSLVSDTRTQQVLGHVINEH